MSLRPSLLFSWVATMLVSGVGIGAGSGPLPPRAAIQTYSWGFTGSAGSNLAACATIPLGVFSGSQQSTGVPPYYMMAFPVSGRPMTSLIGTDASALEWTVAFPVGTLLLLGVVDSLGTSGGIDTGVYTVVGGSTTQCIPSDSRPTFTITSNLTSGSTLSTCDGWQLSIQGGTPPYKVTLAPSNSADVVNVTLGPNDSVFNYLNQSPPGSQLLAAVSDSTGRWATDGPTVQTSSSKDMTCNGLSSSSGPVTSTSPVNPPSVSPTAHSGISRKTIAIIGGSVGGAVLLLALTAIFLWARRRRDRELEWSGSEVAPARSVSQKKLSHLVPLSTQDPTYIQLEKHFQDGWTHLSKPKPQVHAIFTIVLTEDSLGAFLQYRALVETSRTPRDANEQLLFHGTAQSCLLGDEKRGTQLCKIAGCLLCSVIRNSFDVSKCGKRHKFCRFGTGIYTTTSSSKADDYFKGVPESPFRIVLVNRVVVGNPLTQQSNAEEITELPFGYHSVVGVPGASLNYEETVVYNNNAIRPAYLIVYAKTMSRRTMLLQQRK
ncbi:PARP catalytic domain-containing protein [Mycena venus]|uniref:PARP catalytic domain-containing protein n=1 Tax=Mycena venus TaxID=2733690 RepID=A0A8H7CKZ1_9AGAR|nr:PARP catalytic domain-containing protein [Mycena venus]